MYDIGFISAYAVCNKISYCMDPSSLNFPNITDTALFRLFQSDQTVSKLQPILYFNYFTQTLFLVSHVYILHIVRSVV